MSESVETQNIPKPKSGTYLRPAQIADIQSEKAVLEHNLQDPSARIEDRGAVTAQIQRLASDLETQAAPEISGLVRDKVARRVKELSDKISGEMLSQEEMRKNPPGAVGRLMEFERKYKNDIIELKNGLLMLNPDSTDPDVANIETLRPQTNHQSMLGAQIEGKDFSFPSEAFKAGYEHIDWAGEAEKKKLLEENLALRQQIDALNRADQEKPQVVPKPNPGEVEMRTLPCGKEFRGNKGYAMHFRSCKICQEAEVS